MINIGFTILKEPDVTLQKYVVEGLKKGMFLLEGKVKSGFGVVEGRPKVRTGNLRRSIRSRVIEKNNEVEGGVGSKVHYSRILELGGRRPNGSYQRPLPYIRPEFEDTKNINKVKEYIIEAIVKGNKHAE